MTSSCNGASSSLLQRDTEDRIINDKTEPTDSSPDLRDIFIENDLSTKYIEYSVDKQKNRPSRGDS